MKGSHDVTRIWGAEVEKRKAMAVEDNTKGNI